MIPFFKRLKFNLKAQTAHGLHSPFVFKLYSDVLNPHLLNGFDYQKIIIEISAYYHLAPFHFSSTSIDYKNQLILLDQNDLELFSLKLTEKWCQFSGSIILIYQPHLKSEAKWDKLINHSNINFSIDIFDLGILTIDKIAPKQHFYLKKLS